MKTPNPFPALLEAFFTERLMRQRQASPNTISSYRDAFRLLFAFLLERLGKAPSQLTFDDLDAPVVAEFLHWLETNRHNSVRTRNARLAALHSFFGHVALREPAHSARVQRILAIPGKRRNRAEVEYLTRAETEALPIPDWPWLTKPGWHWPPFPGSRNVICPAPHHWTFCSPRCGNPVANATTPTLDTDHTTH